MVPLMLVGEQKLLHLKKCLKITEILKRIKHVKIKDGMFNEE